MDSVTEFNEDSLLCLLRRLEAEESRLSLCFSSSGSARRLAKSSPDSRRESYEPTALTFPANLKN